jgi:hypothetical protein
MNVEKVSAGVRVIRGGLFHPFVEALTMISEVGQECIRQSVVGGNDCTNVCNDSCFAIARYGFLAYL